MLYTHYFSCCKQYTFLPLFWKLKILLKKVKKLHTCNFFTLLVIIQPMTSQVPLFILPLLTNPPHMEPAARHFPPQKNTKSLLISIAARRTDTEAADFLPHTGSLW